MLAEKQKIVSALDDMTEIEIQNLWAIIQHNHPQCLSMQSWDNIPYDIPTEEEKAILDSIDEDDDDFIPRNDMLEKLGISFSDLRD